jgi:superfamily II DNA or RNA helicase
MLENDMRVLIIVPTTQLAHQLAGDFADYSSHVEWNVDENVHKIMSGVSKNTNKSIVISTFQSLIDDRVNPAWFNQFDMVAADECHMAKAKSFIGIFEKCTNVPYRFGFTGSMGKSETNSMVIRGLLGPVEVVSKTKKLIEEGTLSDIKIKCIVLDHSQETKELFTKKGRKTKSIEYQQEIDFLVSHQGRNKFIRNLCLSLEGNTLILFNLIDKHGKLLHELIAEKSGERPVHFIHGDIESEDRDKIRAIIEKSNNSIIIASNGTFSTGVNLRKIHNIIFASPTKSVIRVLQSIGRGLRTAEGKTHLNLFDISDKLTESKTKSNHTFRHLIERLALYRDEEFNYKIMEVKID